jgi:hypothetical protein
MSKKQSADFADSRMFTAAELPQPTANERQRALTDLSLLDFAGVAVDEVN